MKGNYLSSSRLDEIEKIRKLKAFSQSPYSADSMEQSKEKILEN